MLEWHLCQIRYPLEIKLLLLLFLLLLLLHVYKTSQSTRFTDLDLVSVQMLKSQMFFRIPLIVHENE